MSDGMKFQQAQIYANTLIEPTQSPVVAHPEEIIDPAGAQRIIVKDGFWKRLWKKFKK